MTKHIFISTENHALPRFAFIAAVLQFFVIFLDAYVRIATLSNPIGFFILTCQNFLPILVDGCIIFLIGLALRLRHSFTYKIVFACILLFLFALSNILLNQIVKDVAFQPIITLLHLLSNLAILSLFWWLSAFTSPRSLFIFRGSHQPRYRILTWIGIILIFIQIMLGGWVTIHHAKFVCPDFPFCNGQILPPMDFRTFILPFDTSNTTALVTFHMTHRIGVILASLYMLILCMMLVSNRQLSEMGLLLLILLVCHFILGILSVNAHPSIWLILSYELSAIVLLLAMISLLIVLYRKPDESW